MSFTNNPAEVLIDRLRLKVGDTDEFEEGLSDETYEYLYSVHLNENRTALEALKMLVFHYARYVTEKAGGLFVKEAEKYDHYKQLLDLVTKDPTFSFLTAGKPYAGGITQSDLTYKQSLNPLHLGEGSLGFITKTSQPLSFRGWN